MQRAQASQPQIRACFPLHADTERKLFLLKRNSSQQGLWLILSSQLMIKGNRSAATVFTSIQGQTAVQRISPKLNTKTI